MRRGATWLSLALWGLLAASGFAQPRLGGSLEQNTSQWPGTTVQLPTFSFFSVGTTVSVPDRGSAYLGGIKRAATGRNEFGVPMLPFRPFKNSAIGREVSASSVHVTATIHDFEAMDEFLLSQPTAICRSLQSRPAGGGLAALGRASPPRKPAIGPSWKPSSVAGSGRVSTGSLAEARARRFRLQETRAKEAVELFERGRKAEAAGRDGVAGIYYQMAVRRATGEFKEQLLARLETLGRAQTPSKIAQSRP